MTTTDVTRLCCQGVVPPVSVRGTGHDLQPSSNRKASHRPAPLPHCQGNPQLEKGVNGRLLVFSDVDRT